MQTHFNDFHWMMVPLWFACDPITPRHVWIVPRPAAVAHGKGIGEHCRSSGHAGSGLFEKALLIMELLRVLQHGSMDNIGHHVWLLWQLFGNSRDSAFFIVASIWRAFHHKLSKEKIVGGQRVAATLHCTTKEDQPLHRCYRKTRCIDALHFSFRFFRFCWPVSIWTTLCHSIIVLNHGEQFAPVGMLQLLHHKGTTPETNPLRTGTLTLEQEL